MSKGANVTNITARNSNMPSETSQQQSSPRPRLWLWTRLLPTFQPSSPTLALLPLLAASRIATMGMPSVPSHTDLVSLTDASPPPPPSPSPISPHPHRLTFGSTLRACAVCQEEYTSGDNLLLLHPCNHCFHTACIRVWLDELHVCPVCKTPVTVPNRDPKPRWDCVQLLEVSITPSWLQWVTDLLHLYNATDSVSHQPP